MLVSAFTGREFEPHPSQPDDKNENKVKYGKCGGAFDHIKTGNVLGRHPLSSISTYKCVGKVAGSLASESKGIGFESCY